MRWTFLYIVMFLIAVPAFSKGKIASGFYRHKHLTSDTIAEGLVYKHIMIGKRETKHSVRVIECDLTNPNLSPTVMKAGENNYSTEKIQDMINRADSVANQNVVAAINANFWRAYSLYPIGPTIVNGEVVEKYRYKKWSSMFFDSTDSPFIDTFDISVQVIHNTDTLDIHRINRRYDTTLICMYNKFYGDKLPRVLEKDIKELYELELETSLLDTLYKDSTEFAFDSLKLKQRITESQREENFEFSCLKVVLEYLDSPAINKSYQAMITQIDTGVVDIPQNGCVLSFPNLSRDSINFKATDIVDIKTSTNKSSDIVFYNSICGTPRLVRSGNPTHEAYKEGSKGRRFIKKRLPRSACGYNKDKTKLYLVICDPTSSSLKRKAANLSDMAAIMKSLGCYDAINLDGGGSSYMVVNGKNVTYQSNPLRGRKVSVSLGIILNNL